MQLRIALIKQSYDTKKKTKKKFPNTKRLFFIFISIQNINHMKLFNRNIFWSSIFLTNEDWDLRKHFNFYALNSFFFCFYFSNLISKNFGNWLKFELIEEPDDTYKVIFILNCIQTVSMKMMWKFLEIH